MTKTSYDVVILGGGNAAMGVTVPTREAGLSVAMVEQADLGGTCPNRGCTPKKVLVAAAHALHEIEQAPVHGIAVGEAKLDWPALIAREKEMIAGIPGALGKLMESRGVEVFTGQARFVGPKAVEVNGTTLEGRNIVIATGSTPRRLPLPGAELMITSDEVLSEDSLPGEVIFIGGGVIAMEFSHVYARAGAKVTILEALPRLLPALDAEAVEQIRGESERIGVTVKTGVSVKSIEQQGKRLRVTFEAEGEEQALEADRVVNGTGRVPNVEGLNLEAANVEQDRGRLAVDETLRSRSNPAVHVCGDVLWSSPQLSPIATYEGRLVGRNIAEGTDLMPDYGSIPSCVYTVPALASVGLTEEKAQEQGLHYRAQATDMSGWLSARTYGETAAWAKVLVEEKSDRILGAHMVGHAGEELIHLFAMAMKHGITASEIKDSVFGFPTFASDLKNLI